MADSVFSGGGGSSAGQVPPQTVIDLMAILNAAAVQTYIIDPNGAKIEVAFSPAKGTVAITAGGATTILPFVKK